MLIGVFLRHFKNHSGASFIPFIKDEIKNLNIFIGENGAGKSAILESLDTYFNGKNWIINNQVSKKEEAFISPLFLFEEEKVNRTFPSYLIPYLKVISSFFWNLRFSQSTNYRVYSSFFKLRDYLLNNGYNKSYYLISVGLSYNEKSANFVTFDNAIKNKLKEKLGDGNVSERNIDLLYEFLTKDLFTYLYIPVETPIGEFLRLEAEGMQALMNKSVKQEIDKKLNSKVFEGETDGKNYSLLDIINEQLFEFVKEAEYSIQKLDSSYDFRIESRKKRNLTANDIRDKIINSYYSKRELRKDNKPINSLSAGERKKALIDIAYSFLSQSENTEKEVIFAIDEPESSLHISKCYEQFEKIEEVANNYYKQVLVSTQWYGSLPVIEKGSLGHLEVASNQIPNIKNFNLENFFEERRSHPDDIQMKSFFDLTSSVVNSLRNNYFNWIIVEGYSDKIYLEKFLPDRLKFKILPVGGASNVLKTFDYLYPSINHSKNSENIKGKIVCLVDTDEKTVFTKNQSQTQNSRLIIRRLQNQSPEKKYTVELSKIEHPCNEKTEIEDSLNPSNFYDTLKEMIDESECQEVKEAFAKYQFEKDTPFSYIKGNYSILRPRKQASLLNDWDTIQNFLEENKDAFAKRYIKKDNGENLTWINQIIELL